MSQRAVDVKVAGDAGFEPAICAVKVRRSSN
jgi:hypothetical protein